MGCDVNISSSVNKLGQIHKMMKIIQMKMLEGKGNKVFCREAQIYFKDFPY